MLLLILIICVILLSYNKEGFDVFSDIRNFESKITGLQTKITNAINDVNGYASQINNLPDSIRDNVVRPITNPIQNTLNNMKDTIKREVVDPAVRPLTDFTNMLKNIKIE